VFSQIAIVLLGLFLIAMGFREGDYINVGSGILVAAFAASTLYKLKYGKWRRAASGRTEPVALDQNVCRLCAPKQPASRFTVYFLPVALCGLS
jgi:hypothetical protein